MKLYTITHLFDALAKEGISATSKPTYLKYEKMGVFVPGKYSIVHGKRIERVFTKEELDDNVQRFKAWKIAALQNK